MANAFDPYHQWLGISPKDQPPNHYRLLGVDLFESNPNVISNAADQRMAHVRSFQTGQHTAASQRLLNEIAAARVCLLNPAKQAEYDAALRGGLPSAVAVVEVSIPAVVPRQLAGRKSRQPDSRAALVAAAVGVLVVVGMAAWHMSAADKPAPTPTESSVAAREEETAKTPPAIEPREPAPPKEVKNVAAVTEAPEPVVVAAPPKPETKPEAPEPKPVAPPPKTELPAAKPSVEEPAAKAEPQPKVVTTPPEEPGRTAPQPKPKPKALSQLREEHEAKILVGKWIVVVGTPGDRWEWTFREDGKMVGPDGAVTGTWRMESNAVIITWPTFVPKTYDHCWESFHRPIRATGVVGDSWRGRGLLRAVKKTGE